MKKAARAVLWGVVLAVCAGIWGCGPTAFMVQAIPGDRALRETQIATDEGAFIRDKIAVIEVEGTLANRRQRRLFGAGENPVSVFVEKLEKAKKDPEVKGIVVRVNSPGGTVAASEAMHHALGEFRKESKKAVVASILDVGASGAYYVACGSDGIVAQPTSVTGSIGTIMQIVNFEGTMGKLGIKATAIKSGTFKDIGSPLRDMTDEERKILQGIIMEFDEQFIAAVSAGRTALGEAKVRELADGRVWSGAEAKKIGLVDRTGYPKDAVDWVKEKAGVKKARVVMYGRPEGYKANIYSSEAEASGGGALVNVELPEWLNPGGAEFLYMWQPGTGH